MSSWMNFLCQRPPVSPCVSSSYVVSCGPECCLMYTLQATLGARLPFSQQGYTTTQPICEFRCSDMIAENGVVDETIYANQVAGLAHVKE